MTSPLLRQLCSRPDVHQRSPNLFFAQPRGDRLSSDQLSRIAAELGQTVLLFQGDEHDEAEGSVGVCFNTHCHGAPLEWGWQRQSATLECITPQMLIQPWGNILWDCEQTLVLFAPEAPTRARLEAIAASPVLLGLDLDALVPTVACAVGSSCHSGDFIWVPAEFR